MCSICKKDPATKLMKEAGYLMAEAVRQTAKSEWLVKKAEAKAGKARELRNAWVEPDHYDEEAVALYCSKAMAFAVIARGYDCSRKDYEEKWSVR